MMRNTASESTRQALITELDQVTPTWLMMTLRRAGVLEQAEITAVHVGARKTTSFSTIAHLELTYDRPAAAPAKLVLKFSLPTRPVQVAERGWEVRFYTQLAPALADGPLLRCYDAVFAPEQGRLHLLLEDLSATHEPGEASHLPPTEPQCRQIIDALARVHTHWWSRPPLDTAGYGLPTADDLVGRAAGLAARAAAFQAMLGDRLSPARQQIYREVVDALPRLFTRLCSPFAMSVVHDDIHVGNFLYPRDPARDTLRIIDWQTWTADLAVKDLAHMLAFFWFPERRARFEIPLLHYYLERLQAYGVRDYTWAQLFDDYRFCVIRKLFHPAWQWEVGDNTSKWWLHLERIMLAYEDLACRELVCA